MKKFLSFLLTFVMLFSLTMPAMAAEVTGNTDNPTEGEVSATWNPEIAFTGIVVDDENSDEYRYDETSKTYTIIIPADEVGGTGYLSYDIIGTNLTLIEDTNTLLKVQHENEDGLTSAPDDLLVDVLQDNGYFGWSVLGYGDGEWEKLLYSNDGGMTWTTYTFEVKQAYSITVNASQNGTVTANEYAIEGDNIALNVSPAEGYMLDTLSVTDASGNSVTVENNQFTMPASAVSVSATFKEATPHKINIGASENGSVTADLSEATVGTTVTLTVTPADDYRLSAVTVNDGAVEVTKVNDTTYTFVMPDADVTVNATFEKIPHSVNVETSLVVVESRYTFYVVPSAKFVCEIFKYLLRLISGVNFGQGDNQLPCFDTLSVCSASPKLLLTLFCKVTPKGIVCGAVGGIEVFLSCVACNIRYSSLDIGQL